MGLNVFHTCEILHDVCLEDGRLLVMFCNDDCKELHPYAFRLVVMAVLHERWKRMQDRHLERLPDQKAGRACLMPGRDPVRSVGVSLGDRFQAFLSRKWIAGIRIITWTDDERVETMSSSVA